jgi:DNA repair exonuclease SbcCD ATPase subunit
MLETDKERLKKEVEEVKPKYDEHVALVKRRDEISREALDAATHIGYLKMEVSKLKDHEYDPNCKYCISNAFVKSAERAKEELTRMDDILEMFDEQLNEVGDKLAPLIDIPGRYKKMVEDVNQLKLNLTTAQHAEATLGAADAKVELHEKQLEEIRRQIKEYHGAREAIQTNNAIDAEIAHLQSLRSIVVVNMRSLETELRKLGGQLAVLEARKATMLDKIKEAEDLETQYEAYEYYLAAICRDGLPYKLIAEVLPAVEAGVNNILAQMVDFTIALDVDGKNINGKLIYDTDRSWPLELASGMEKFISGLAIRVALMTISSLPKSNFLIVDEGIGTLDSDNLASISALFDVLKAQFSFVLLISHVDAVRDMTDRLLDIHRSDGYSYNLGRLKKGA